MTNDIKDDNTNDEDWEPDDFLGYAIHSIVTFFFLALRFLIPIFGVIIAYKVTLYIIDVLKGWGWW